MDLRKSLTFPENLNISLSEFFDHVTFDLYEIVFSLAVGTAKKREGSNYTAFKFKGKETKHFSGNLINLSPCERSE